MMNTFKKILSKLHRKKILLVLPVLFIIPSLSALLVRDVTIFPLHDTYTYYSYSDSSEENGFSEVTRCTFDTAQIIFEYILKEGYEYPYAGFQINVNTDTTFLDVSKHDYLDLEIKANNTKKLNIYCKTFIDGLTQLDDYNTHRFLEKEIELIPGQEHYRIRLDEFQTASWWLNDNNLAEKDIGKPDFSKFMNLAIASANYAHVDTAYNFVITGISCTRNNTRAYLSTVAAIVFYFLIYLIVLLVQKRLSSPVVIPYKKLEVESYVDEEAGRIVELIAQQFQDSEISVARIGQEAGVLPTRIPVILKKKFKCTFKQYLNKIRMSEAKRLLKETDRQIADIAYTVGYNNVTHFHRIFKQFHDISPNEYRKSEST